MIRNIQSATRAQLSGPGARDGLVVCECCAMLAANGDESSCRDYFRHERHALTSAPPGHIVIGDDLPVTARPRDCDGCGQEIGTYGASFDAAVLS
jgi:hypothetical protein